MTQPRYRVTPSPPKVIRSDDQCDDDDGEKSDDDDGVPIMGRQASAQILRDDGSNGAAGSREHGFLVCLHHQHHLHHHNHYLGHHHHHHNIVKTMKMRQGLEEAPTDLRNRKPWKKKQNTLEKERGNLGKKKKRTPWDQRRGHSAPFGATLPIHQTPDTSVCALECARIPAHQYSDAPITLHCCWCIGVCIGAILCWSKLVTQDTLGAKKALLPLPMLKLCTPLCLQRHK